MDEQGLARIREDLLQRRAILAGDVDHLADEVRSGSAAHMPSDLADAGQDAAVHDLSVTRMASEEDEIYHIDEALRKIEAGEYGDCEECSEPINPERLEALPHVRFCIACQQAYEQRQ